jgi:hypothetical protein
MWQAAGGQPIPAQARSRDLAQRSVCIHGQSDQSLQTCLREAHAACAQARRAGLDDGAVDDARNALLRCERLSPDESAACAARMQGAGTVSGSAASGGIYRERVTTEPAKVDKPPAGR